MAFLVLDLELSGTEPGWHEIIQIGAVLCDENWQERATFLSNVYPENEKSFSESAQKVHGLSLDDLDDAPMLHEVLPEFEAWIVEHLPARPPKHVPGALQQALRNVIICGQSVVYDVNFLKFAYRQEKLAWPFAQQIIDLYTISYFVFNRLQKTGHEVPRSRSLGAIAGYFGLGREEDTHNALEDAQLTAACFRHILGALDRQAE